MQGSNLRPLPSVDPATEQPFTAISLGSKADIDLAVGAARRAFDGFCRSAGEDRLGLLRRILDVYNSRAEDLAEAVSREIRIGHAETNHANRRCSGPGVQGTLFAVRLSLGGHEVSLVARGSRAAQLARCGAIIEDIRSGRRWRAELPVSEKLELDCAAELCLVTVRREQLESVLPIFAATQIPRFVFLVNHANGSESLYEALGRKRVVSAFPGFRRDRKQCRSFRRNLGASDGCRSVCAGHRRPFPRSRDSYSVDQRHGRLASSPRGIHYGN